MNLKCFEYFLWFFFLWIFFKSNFFYKVYIPLRWNSLLMFIWLISIERRLNQFFHLTKVNLNLMSLFIFMCIIFFKWLWQKYIILKSLCSSVQTFIFIICLLNLLFCLLYEIEEIGFWIGFLYMFFFIIRWLNLNSLFLLINVVEIK